MHGRHRIRLNDGHLNALAAAQLLVGDCQVDNFVAVIVKVHHLVSVRDIQVHEIVEMVVDIQHQRMRLICANVDQNCFGEDASQSILFHIAGIRQVVALQVGLAIDERQRLFINI